MFIHMINEIELLNMKYVGYLNLLIHQMIFPITINNKNEKKII